MANSSTDSTSEARFRRVFEAARDSILLVDPGTGRIIDSNPSVRRVLGHEPERVLGQTLCEIGLFDSDEAWESAVRELARAGHVFHPHVRAKTHQGEPVELELDVTLSPDGTQEMIQCHLRECANHRGAAPSPAADLESRAAALESEARLRDEELRSSTTQLEIFVYIIAHDLRAPLRAMQGFAQLLVDDYGHTLDPEGRRFAEIISRSAQKLDRQLTDLLSLSHVHQHVTLECVDLGAAVRSALALVADRIETRGARVELPTTWPGVAAQPAILHQVLVNLIDHTLKHWDDHAPCLQMQADDRQDGYVRLSVENRKIGCDPALLDQVFPPFERLHTTAYSGSGLGLAIVRKGVERMGGRVGVLCVPGEASRLWIELRTARRFEPAGAPI